MVNFFSITIIILYHFQTYKTFYLLAVFLKLVNLIFPDVLHFNRIYVLYIVKRDWTSWKSRHINIIIIIPILSYYYYIILIIIINYHYISSSRSCLFRKNHCCREEASHFRRFHSGRTSSMREVIISGRPRVNFPRKFSKENIRKTVVSQNRRKKHETFIEISKRKQKWEKRKLETFLLQRLFKYEYSVDLPFCFKIYQKSNTLLKLRGLLL